MKNKTYQKYPWGIVLVTNFIMLLGIVAGAYIMFRLHWIMAVIYLAYVIIYEFSIYKEGCRHCCYFNSRCAFGKSSVARIFFKKGNPKKFQRKISWKQFIPIIIGSLAPVIVGIALLISRGFHLLTLLATIYPVFNWFVINPLLFGKLACKHCRQGRICCPALEFFSKTKRKK